MSPFILACVLLFAAAPSQEIPKGVVYKRGSESLNKKASDKLKQLIASKPDKADFSKLSAKAVVCGPGLWLGIKDALKNDLDGTVPAYFVDPRTKVRLEGRVFKTPASLENLWIAVMVAMKGPKPIVRKAKAAELQYYWAIINYDIEEPLWMVEVGKRQLLFDFDTTGGDPKVMFVDIVGQFAR